MNLTLYLVVWLLLALSVAGLALYRKMIAVHQDDDLVHLASSEQNLIPRQIAIAKKLTSIDRWGQTMTVIAFLAGLLLAALWLYEGWQISQGVR